MFSLLAFFLLLNFTLCLIKKFSLTNICYFTAYFYSGCLCLETISLILSIVVINMSKRVYCKPLPRNIRLCLLSWPGKLLGLSDLISVVIKHFKVKNNI